MKFASAFVGTLLLVATLGAQTVAAQAPPPETCSGTTGLIGSQFLSCTSGGVTLTVPATENPSVCTSTVPTTDTITLSAPNIPSSYQTSAVFTVYYTVNQSLQVVQEAGNPVSVTLNGPFSTQSFQVTFPPATQWPITDATLNPALREAHVGLVVFVRDTANQNAVVGLLGPGQDWDTDCFPTTPPPPPPPNPLTKGETATIGFWHNKNGQALINSLNGGPTSHNLANWLASNFPNLYGSGCGATNLTGKTNADVAALFLQDFDVKGQKLDAQVLATALAVYSTSTNLAGSDIAASYGFVTSASGTGSATINVGSNGAAFGIPNNSVVTIFDLLKDTNAMAVNCVIDNGNTTLQNMTNNVFDGINTSGDIS